MCCETHELRDFLAARRGGPLPLAPADDRRCRCAELGKWPGLPCDRGADGEDLLCPWCRATDHLAWYSRAARDPLAGEYYRQHGVPYDVPGGLEAAEASFSPGPAISGAGSLTAVPAYGPGQPFTFTPDEIAPMRAAEGDSPLARELSGHRLDAAGEMTAGDVMKYLQRRYGTP